MKEQVEAFLSREMDRKDFLKQVAAAGLLLMGGGVILQTITRLGGANASRAQMGYGSSPYGGNLRD